MRELIIIRHGEAEHMTNGLTGGWPHARLTALGRQQAQLTGVRLAHLLDGREFAFHSSDFARTAETSQIIAGSLGGPAVLAPGLRELDHGEAAGLTHEEASKIALPMTEPVVDWRPYPGAESWGEMSSRVHSFMDSITDTGHDLALIVTHGSSGNAVINWWLGFGNGRNITFEMDPCSISWFGINRWGERTVVKLNDTGHLSSAHRNRPQ